MGEPLFGKDKLTREEYNKQRKETQKNIIRSMYAQGYFDEQGKIKPEKTLAKLKEIRQKLQLGIHTDEDIDWKNLLEYYRKIY